MLSATLRSPQSALKEARQHHACGNLLAAAEAYRRTLDAEPQSQAALLGVSLIARQSNQLEPALHMAQAALLADGCGSALAWANLGDCLQSLGRISEAESSFRHATALDGRLGAAHFGLGNTLAQRDDFCAALACFETALRLSPAIPEFHFAVAFAESKLGDHARAIGGYRRAVALRPAFASAWLNLGVELVADGRDSLADLCYGQALECIGSCGQHNHPSGVSTQVSAHLNFGHLARSRRQFPQVRDHYGCALALAESVVPSRLAEVHLGYAYLHLEQGVFPEAWASLELAESVGAGARDNSEIANARGILLLAEEAAKCDSVPSAVRIEKAIAAFERAEAMGHKTAPSNRGNALLRLGRCREALTAHEAALDREKGGDPYHPGVRYNLALTQLRLGDFARGWSNYEIRWSFREVHPRPRRFAQPRWQGEPLAGLTSPATLLIYGEQGLGDTIQFIRYLPLVAEQVANWMQAAGTVTLLVEVQPALTRLLAPFVAELSERHPGLCATIVACGDQLPPFTHHCPLLSLPSVFSTTLETIPFSSVGGNAYLEADPEMVALRASELAADSSQLRRIGIAWAGNPNYKADRERSTKLETFAPLLRIPGILWVSLQKGEAAGQIADVRPILLDGLRLGEVRLYDGCSADRDFADTAALIANLDLVITTDTAVAHLAGALGKPLWLLLPWQSDWRWMQDRLDTPWYPTARLFRQSCANDWPELVTRVALALCKSLMSAQVDGGEIQSLD